MKVKVKATVQGGEVESVIVCQCVRMCVCVCLFVYLCVRAHAASCVVGAGGWEQACQEPHVTTCSCPPQDITFTGSTASLRVCKHRHDIRALRSGAAVLALPSLLKARVKCKRFSTQA